MFVEEIKKRTLTDSLPDEQMIKQIFQKGCEKGIAEECYNFATIRTDEIKNDFSSKEERLKIGEYYEKACNLGMVKGCFSGGEFYEKRGTDYSISIMLYNKACDRGNETACRKAREIKSYLKWRNMTP